MKCEQVIFQLSAFFEFLHFSKDKTFLNRDIRAPPSAQAKGVNIWMVPPGSPWLCKKLNKKLMSLANEFLLQSSEFFLHFLAPRIARRSWYFLILGKILNRWYFSCQQKWSKVAFVIRILSNGKTDESYQGHQVTHTLNKIILLSKHF